MTDTTDRSASGKPRQTLTDADMVTNRPLGRRSLLATVGGALVGVTALVAGTSPAHAVTDSDSGACADPGGRGRGPQVRGVTDSDSGSCADPAQYGRRGSGSGGCTDSDSGAGADPAGGGRRCRGSCTDSDSGARADRAGQGRRC